MERPDRTPIDRRLAISGLAAAVGLPFLRTQALRRVITQRGVAGGGLARFADGEAEFSLFASSLITVEDGVEGEPVFLGRLRWADGSVGLALESVRITNYENLGLAEGEGRRIEGVVDAGESGEQSFLLEVRFDLPDSEPGQIAFRVGSAIGGDATPEAAAGYTYVAEGEVVGDFTGADFAVDLETGDVTEPEPA